MELVIGTIIPFVIQWAKKRFNLVGDAVLLLVFFVALVSAIVYHLFVFINVWDIFVPVIGTTFVVYEVIIKSWNRWKKNR